MTSKRPSAFRIIDCENKEREANGATPKGFVERRQARFLAAYAEYGMISRAARVAKTTRWSHQDWMKDHYAKRFREAGDRFTQKVEDTLHLVGVHGVERPILHKGKQVFIEGKPPFENRRAEQVLLRIAEARMPEKYKPRVEQTNLGDIDPDKFTPALIGTSTPASLRTLGSRELPISALTPSPHWGCRPRLS
jgi:hypothetical protein